MEKNNKRKLIYTVLGIIAVLIITLSVTYAYWILTREQTSENIVKSACLNITFTGKNDIVLENAYPMKEEELESFLSSATPYHFTIHNECNSLASTSINLESLNVNGKALEDDYIDAILYENDYNSNLNINRKLTRNTSNDENKVVAEAKHAYSLYNFYLKPNETKEFNLLLYMDLKTPMEDENMNASWKGKITLSAGYKLDSKAIRKISYNDQNGMWGYKDKLTKIEIEDIKSEKQAPEGGHVYGPFDESEYQTKTVESYVVCEEDDTNCIGYLQSDGKVIANSDSSSLFNGFKKVTVIEGLNNLDTHNVVNMNSMFQQLPNLQSLDISSFDTINVTNMTGMFSGASSLTTLDLSNLDTRNVTSMVAMFNWCSLLTDLKLNNLDTRNVTDMSGMFAGASSLTTLDLSNFETPNLINISGMFSGMSNLQSINLSSFDTTNLQSIGGIFSGSTNLAELNLNNWKFSDNMSANFSSITSLNSLENLNKILLENVDTSNVTNMYRMFYGMHSLQSIDLSSFDTSNVNNMSDMFSGMSSLQSLDLSNFDTTSLQNVSNMFLYDTNLTELNLNNWKFNDNLSAYFSSKTSLNSLKNLNKILLKNVDTSHVTDMSGMFVSTSSLTALDLSNFDTSHVTKMTNMFYEMSNIQTLDLSMFDTSNVTEMSRVFYEMKNLENLDINNWDLRNISTPLLFNNNLQLQTINMTNVVFPINCSNFFRGLTNLSSLTLENVDTSYATDMSYMFAEMSSILSLDLSDFDTSHVTDMDYIFSGMTNLQNLDVSNWVLPSDSSVLFYNLANLEKINLNNVNTTKVTSMRAMFGSCQSLTSLDLSYFDTSNVTNMVSMFYNTTSLKTIIYGQKFIRNNELETVDMFSDCLSQDRPTHESWRGIFN